MLGTDKYLGLKQMKKALFPPAFKESMFSVGGENIILDKMNR
jgi:hypothetical protein